MDKSMIGDLDSLPEADKLKMAAMIDQLQIRDRFLLFSFLFDVYMHVFTLYNKQEMNLLMVAK